MTTPPRKILPRNVTALVGAAREYQVVGNPVVTRPEDAVANCYPGLELDVRNLDRRFFPGLVFDFAGPEDVEQCGARLAYVDHKRDPDALANRELFDAIADEADTLAVGAWFLEWIEQRGKRLSMREPGSREPLHGLVVWRVVRGLELEPPLTIALRRRDARARLVTFKGSRRRFVDQATGVLNQAYQPGELTQSLCSPWQHDFRDCACHYWASNRPDVVEGETYPGEAAAGKSQGLDPFDWMRRDRSPDVSAGALETIDQNRPFQLDHFEINQAWRTLDIVVNNREIGDVYVPGKVVTADPYPTVEALAKRLRELAELEMALAIEYIYALFSVRSSEEVRDSERWATLRGDLDDVRARLLRIATSEMRHLRSANELLWMLREKGVPFTPVLKPATRIPTRDGHSRDAALRPLSPDVLEDFIVVEAPSGLVSGGYARVVATLQSEEYPPRMRQLSWRIVKEGVEHEEAFRHMKDVLDRYAKAPPPCPYLRELRPAEHGEAREAIEHYRRIVKDLTSAYRAAGEGHDERSGQTVSRARIAMMELLALGDRLAREKIGIPFFDAVLE